MKFTAAKLQDFLSILPVYESLPIPAKRDLASIRQPSKAFDAFSVRGSLNVLVEAGFLLPADERGRCSIAPLRQDFVRILRWLRPPSIFQDQSHAVFANYMALHLSVVEREALRGRAMPYHQKSLALFQTITSPDWTEGFLSAHDGDWERPYLLDEDLPLFANVDVFGTAQSLVRWLFERGRPAKMSEIPDFSRNLFSAGPEFLGQVLQAALRYALVFAALDPDTMDALIGLWPSITAHAVLANEPPPDNVTPDESWGAPFLLDDMTVLLVACAAEPLRLRANDGQLFAKTVRDLTQLLGPLPKWVEESCDLDPETRLLTAVSFVRTFEFVEEEEEFSSPTQMAVSPQGRRWLGLKAGDRLRIVIDGILGREQAVEEFQDFAGTKIGALTPYLQVTTSMQSPPDLHTEVMKPFRSLGDGFYQIPDIARHALKENPLAAILRRDKNAYFAAAFNYLYRPDTEKLNQLWTQVVLGLVRARLLPTGGVRLGKGPKGLSIELTPLGRYFLGETKKWRWETLSDAQVIVQPNFEVTFLGEAPAVEAELSRFAERRGRQMGALFQITKKSIFAASAVGLTSGQVLEILERCCTRELPGNVRREIQGWFAQCRRVSFESVSIIRCPDRETALLITGLAKGSAVVLTDTILEYRDSGSQRPALLKKLKELGVLVSVQEKAKPKAAPVRRRNRW